MTHLAAVTVLVSLALLPGAGTSQKAKKPELELRATPRMAFSPVNILLTAELKGGDDVEDMYCPELEWDWDDGGKSVREPDCAPFEAGVTKIERRFTEEHNYRRAGVYTVKLTLKHSGHSMVTQTVRVTVRPGLGDQTIESPNP